jgi:hypothetical protein
MAKTTAKLMKTFFAMALIFLQRFDELMTIESAILWERLPKIQRTYIKIIDLDNNFI